MKPFLSLLRRDLLLSYRQGIDMAVIVLFFLIAGILFAFALGPSPRALAPIAASIVLVMAGLAALLSLDRLFQGDFEDGSLDQIALSPLGLEFVVLAKALTHWLSAGLPLLIAAMPLALMLRSSFAVLPSLLLALGLTTPALSLLGTFGATLTLGARRSGLLLAFLILPLFVPILIFGAALVPGDVAPDSLGLNFAPDLGQQDFALTLLSAIDLGLLALIPWAGAASLRLAHR